jgi:hypothetical protein
VGQQPRPRRAHRRRGARRGRAPGAAAGPGAPALPAADALQRLEALRALVDTMQGYAQDGVPLRLGLGLWQGDTLAADGGRVWFQAYLTAAARSRRGPRSPTRCARFWPTRRAPTTTTAAAYARLKTFGPS